jgi:hypothetical protein
MLITTMKLTIQASGTRVKVGVSDSSHVLPGPGFLAQADYELLADLSLPVFGVETARKVFER